MSMLIIIKLVAATCAAIIADNQDDYARFESVLDSVEDKVEIQDIGFYHTPIAVNGTVIVGQDYWIKGIKFTCAEVQS